jgi:hypothetical protein
MDPVAAVQNNTAPATFQVPQIPKGESIVTKAHHISKLLFLVPAILIIVTLSGVAFFVNRSSAPAPAPIESVEEEVSEEPEVEVPPITPAPVPTAEIKVVTYKHADGAFVFDYPNNFVVYECVGGVEIFAARGEYVASELCEEGDVGIITIEYSDQEYGTGYSDSSEYQGSTRIMNLATQTALLYDYNRLIVAPDKPDRVVVVITAFNDINYRITLRGSNNVSLFTQVIDTFDFVGIDPTFDWQSFDGESYQFKYPVGWVELGERGTTGALVGDRSEIRAATASASPGLVVSLKENLPNASLSASEVVSSTVNLDGWEGVPTVSFVSISGASAQIIEGPFQGLWKKNVVIWKDGLLIQMTWTDERRRNNESIIENIVATFEFLE